MGKNLKSRVEKLEDIRSKSDELLPYVVVNDGDEIPEGVKAYSPEANPDLWDEGFETLSGSL
jgi:hypothetical protein